MHLVKASWVPKVTWVQRHSAYVADKNIDRRNQPTLPWVVNGIGLAVNPSAQLGHLTYLLGRLGGVKRMDIGKRGCIDILTGVERERNGQAVMD